MFLAYSPWETIIWSGLKRAIWISWTNKFIISLSLLLNVLFLMIAFLNIYLLTYVLILGASISKNVSTSY